jgi:hypothetical protein
VAEKLCDFLLQLGVFPIYWAPQRVGSKVEIRVEPDGEVFRFQFIGFPSEWGDEEEGSTQATQTGFQFIGFPSEWGDQVEIVTPVAGG